MKISALVFIIIALSSLSACRQSTVVDSDFVSAATNGTNNKPENIQPVKSPTPTIDTTLVEIKSKYPLLWETTVRYENFTNTETPLKLFSYDENQFDKPPDKTSPYYQARRGVEVDLMNCGGYLASGRLYSPDPSTNTAPAWLVKIAPETVAKDVAAKIKRCNFYMQNDAPTMENPINSTVFAVAPHKEMRRNITIGEIDTKKVFRSLPKETREMLNTKDALAGGRTKDDLSFQSDNWADLDGDGKIDLVKVYAMYDEEHGNSIIFQLINGKWENIGGGSQA